jgi:hypothetical protein
MCVLIGLALAGSACAEGAAGVPSEKQALVQRVLDKMALDTVGMQMMQAPVADMLRQAKVVVSSRVPAERQDATMKDITADANQFMAEEGPVLLKSTHAIVEQDVAPVLAQKFSVDELKQLAAILESPVLAKFEAAVPELKRAVGENLAKANAARIQPKMTALQNKVGERLRVAAQAPAQAQASGK